MLGFEAGEELLDAASYDDSCLRSYFQCLETFHSILNPKP